MTAYNDEDENLMADRRPDLDPKALEVAKLTFFKEIGCENGGPLELKISILTLGVAFHEALRAYLVALPPSLCAPKGTDNEHA